MTEGPAFCPHCGSDLRLDKPILLNDFSMFGDGYPLMYQHKVVPLSRQQVSVVWTLLKAFPHMVSGDTLLIRIGSDSESNVLDVLISRIRGTMRAQGIPNPIETVRGRGYRWTTIPTDVVSRGGGRPRNASAGNRG